MLSQWQLLVLFVMEVGVCIHMWQGWTYVCTYTGFVPSCPNRLSLTKGLPLCTITGVLSKTFLKKHFTLILFLSRTYPDFLLGLFMVSHCLFESFSHQPSLSKFFPHVSGGGRRGPWGMVIWFPSCLLPAITWDLDAGLLFSAACSLLVLVFCGSEWVEEDPWVPSS